MEDPHIVIQGPRPREPIPLAAYTVQPSSGSTALIVPVHQARGVSESVVSFLAAEMNKEVETAWNKALNKLLDRERRYVSYGRCIYCGILYPVLLWTFCVHYG